MYLKQNIQIKNNHLFVSLKDFANLIWLFDNSIYSDTQRKADYVRMSIWKISWMKILERMRPTQEIKFLFVERMLCLWK